MRLGVSTIYADYQDIKQYAEAVAAVRRGSGTAAIYLATPRIEKPGEANLFSFLARQGADGILVRNAGGMRFCSEHGIPSVADFSLNAANPLTVELLKSRGAARVTASYDLNVDQLLQLIDTTPPSWLEVVIHQQIPMFHMEHCVYLCVPFAGDRRDQLRPSLRPPRREAPRPRRQGASLEGRRRLPQHAV